MRGFSTVPGLVTGAGVPGTAVAAGGRQQAGTGVAPGGGE
jgi:hypothetical protein